MAREYYKFTMLSSTKDLLTEYAAKYNDSVSRIIEKLILERLDTGDIHVEIRPIQRGADTARVPTRIKEECFILIHRVWNIGKYGTPSQWVEGIVNEALRKDGML